MAIEDPHTCGACGYDGGIKNLKEMQLLKDKLNKIEKDNYDPDNTKVKYFIFGLVSIIIVLILAIMSYDMYELGVMDVRTSVLDKAGESYGECVRYSSGEAEVNCHESYRFAVTALAKTFPIQEVMPDDKPNR